MNRKIIICLLTTALLATAPLVQAQQSGKIARIGVIRPEKPDDAGAQRLIDAFRQGLRTLGYVEGQNIAFEIRWAEGKRDRLPELANELVRLKVDLIVTGGATATHAAKKATKMIPIIMANVGDPVGEGFVASLAQPGRNITGLSSISTDLAGKRLELLRETVPTASRVAVLWNANNPGDAREFKETDVIARALGMVLQSLEVRSSKDFESAFQAALRGRVDALIVQSDALIRSHRKRVIDLAADDRLPAIYVDEQFVNAGGLMTYATSMSDLFRRTASYVDKILKGAKPADLPVEQPMKFELVINLKAAKQIGLTIPPNVLARADRVIR
jgi:putative ABC transport system substrate-binding protein